MMAILQIVDRPGVVFICVSLSSALLILLSNHNTRIFSGWTKKHWIFKRCKLLTEAAILVSHSVPFYHQYMSTAHSTSNISFRPCGSAFCHCHQQHNMSPFFNSIGRKESRSQTHWTVNKVVVSCTPASWVPNTSNRFANTRTYIILSLTQHP